MIQLNTNIEDPVGIGRKIEVFYADTTASGGTCGAAREAIRLATKMG